MAPAWQKHATGAALTLAGVVASFCTMYALCAVLHAQSQPAVVSAVLSIGLGRRQRARGLEDALPAALRLAAIAAAATAVGWLLHEHPPLGAAVFTVAMFASVWLRDFGPRARMLGTLVALPLIAILIVPPVDVRTGTDGLIDFALVVAAGIVALFYATVIRSLATSGRIVETPRAVDLEPDAAPRRTSLMTPRFRMALQMAVSLCLAFGLGFLAFPGHWGWVVLTAFIVCSGVRGRGDALYKAVLRFLGAMCGTLVAAALADVAFPTGVLEAVAIFSILFLGLSLREVNYACWACSTTLILALLAGPDGLLGYALLVTRLEAIFAGALCALAATWLVFPIRTESIVRRRLADALLALDELVALSHLEHAEQARKQARFEHRIFALDEVAPPLIWHRRLFARGNTANHPALWIDLAASLRERARALGQGAPPSQAAQKSIRRAIGLSRRAIGDYARPEAERGQTIAGALIALHQTFEAESELRT